MTITLKSLATNYPSDDERNLFIRSYVYDALEYGDVFKFVVDYQKIVDQIDAIKIWRRLNGESRIKWMSDIEKDIFTFLTEEVASRKQSIMDGGI